MVNYVWHIQFSIRNTAKTNISVTILTTENGDERTYFSLKLTKK